MNPVLPWLATMTVVIHGVLVSKLLSMFDI